MRITFVLPELSLNGGIRVISIYADLLRQRGHDVVVVSVQRRRPKLAAQLRFLVKGHGPIPYQPYGPSWFDNLPVKHQRCPHAGPITDEDVPDGDIVIATWWETAEWVWQLSPAKGVKVHFMQDYETWGGHVDRVDASCRLPIPKIVIANWVRDLLRERFCVTPLALVPNSVETEKFFAAPRSKQAPPTVGLSYTAMYNKGADISIAAYQLARQEIPDLRLVAFGNTKVKAQLPLPEGTEYHAFAPDETLRTIYAQCDAWLFGTRIEGFGLPILEAMACRTPVIGTPAGAAPELLVQGGGLLVPAENPPAMAEAIVTIARMPENQWQLMSEAAERTARAYTWHDASILFEAAIMNAYHNIHGLGSPTLPWSTSRISHGQLPSVAR